MDREEILFDINYALRHKFKPRIKWQDEYHSQFAARAVLEHLELCGYRLVRKPPAKGHSTP